MDAAIFKKIGRDNVELKYLDAAKFLQPGVERQMERLGIHEIGFLARNDLPESKEPKLWVVNLNTATQRTFNKNLDEIMKEFKALMLDLFDKVMVGEDQRGKYSLFIEAQLFDHFTLRLKLDDGEDVYFMAGPVFEASV